MNTIIIVITRFMRKYIVQVVITMLIVITVGNKLLPSDSMFLFHDKTQYARVAEFSSALASFQIPPVYASRFNFEIGYPVFLFYAPVAYWITSAVQVIGLGVVDSVKISMLGALLVGAWGMYAWLTKRYARPAALVGAILYVSSPWIASEIFVRGNLASIWFMALAPWSLWSLWLMRQKHLAPIVLIPLTLMTHNALSLIWVIVLFGYAFFGFTQKRLYRMKFLVLTVLISGIFWIPALAHLGLTYAADIAKLTRFSDHFLCIEQIWTTSSWGFGGSAPGCVADGMSFMLGKMQIIFAILGLIAGVFIIQKRRRLFLDSLIVLWALFLTLPDSLPFWKLVPQIQVIQFPWRLLSIALIFIAALSAAAVQVLIEHIKIVTVKDRLKLHNVYRKIVHNILNFTKRWEVGGIFVGKNLTIPSFAQAMYTSVCILIISFAVITSTRYFYGNTISVRDIYKQYVSDRYITQSAAYDIPEYVPKTVDYTYWQRFRTVNPSHADMTRLKKDFDAFRPQPLIQVMALLVAFTSIFLILWLL